jgi:hypothetical protein
MKLTSPPALPEQWLPIADFAAYEVSNLGRVRRILPDCYGRGGKGNILTIRITVHGYVDVLLSQEGRGHSKHRVVHRLVAKAFILNPLNPPAVNHKDGIKTNNAVENLEWTTNKKNTRHAMELGLIKHINGRFA